MPPKNNRAELHNNSARIELMSTYYLGAAWLDSLSENIEVVKFDSFEQVGGMIAGIAQAAEEHAAAQEAESEADSNASDSENSSEGAGSGAENESSEDSGSEG